ncbi:MAG: PleD family two-component system response regulator, partial [Proteobacteria bacterium]|nr:PleD family two-component system response regulator [Pseudomonadota bacterium]
MSPSRSPFRSSSKPSKPISATHESEVRAMTARILVVDDIPANVKLLEARLLAEYFDVLTA